MEDLNACGEGTPQSWKNGGNIVFHHNLELPLIMAQAYQSERLKQAETTRLLKEAGPDGAGLQARLLLKAGDWLIAFGLWLKTRYQAVGHPADGPAPHVG